MREDDTLIVWKLDRLGRNLRHLVNTIHELMERKIGFRVLTGQGANIDTTTAGGRLVFGIFAALAEFERELIRERTIAGLSSARARGRNGGRPYTMTPAKLRLAQAAMADARHQGRRPVQGTGRHASDALPLRRSQGRTATRRREAPQAQKRARQPMIQQEIPQLYCNDPAHSRQADDTQTPSDWADNIDGDKNCFDIIRLIFAYFVILNHSYHLAPNVDHNTLPFRIFAGPYNSAADQNRFGRRRR